MAIKTIQIRRGTDLQRQGVTFASGEGVWTTDLKELWMGDGATLGGVKVVGAVESEITNYVPLSQKGAVNGVATLDGGGKVPTTQLPALAITSVFTAVSEIAMLGLTTQEGDVVIRTDENITYIHNGGSAGTMADFTHMATPTDAVTSVNGATGVVTLTTSDIAEGNNLYYTDGRVDTYVTGTLINDTAGDGVTNRLWSANKIFDELASLTFLGLTDTPASFAGAGTYTVKVNAGATALEFVDESVIDGGGIV